MVVWPTSSHYSSMISNITILHIRPSTPIMYNISDVASGPNAARTACNLWLISKDNKNHTWFNSDKYLEYKAFLCFPNSKVPRYIQQYHC